MKKKTGKAKKSIRSLPTKSLNAKQAGGVKGGQPTAQMTTAPVMKWDLKAQKPV